MAKLPLGEGGPIETERERRGAEITARYLARARRDPTDPWIPLPMLIAGPDMRPSAVGCVGSDRHWDPKTKSQCICGCELMWHWLSLPHSCNECKACQGYSPRDKPISMKERYVRLMQAIICCDRDKCERSVAEWYRRRLDPKIEILRLAVTLQELSEAEADGL